MSALRFHTDDECILALREHGSVRKAAKALGIHPRNLFARKARWVKRGFAPEFDLTHPVADGQKLKGTSTLYREDGTIAAQWVKSTADEERRMEVMREAISAMVEELPKLPPRKAHGTWRGDLLTAYPIGDPHIGMLSWGEETGNAWDLAIAERTHCDAMASLVASSPATEQALIVNLGDALHYDSMFPITARSGNLLDADGRYAKMVRVALKTIRQCIESALTKHKRVHIINVIGNHDETGALWLSAALSHIYDREARVTVDTSPAVFNYFRWGKVLIGCHHGHTCKADTLPGVMAADRAKDWGETLHRYWWCGHIHHASMREYAGVTVESFGTLAAKDAYAAAGGWRARESMTAIVLHREHGEVARNLVSPDMVRAARIAA
jgi:hypothetical protein